MRALLLLLALAASARADATLAPPADGELANIDLQAIDGAACTTCTRIERIVVPKLGTVEIARAAASDLYDGFALVLSVRTTSETRAVPIAFSHGGCGAGTCRDDELHSAHLVKLSGSDPSFGLEVEVTVHVTHTFRDMGAPYDQHVHYRLACAARDGVIDCKHVMVPDGCRMLGWAGTRVRYECAQETELVPARLADVPGIPQADLEAVEALLGDLRKTIWENRDECARLAQQIDGVLARDADAVIIARTLNTPAGAMPKRFTRDLESALQPVTQVHGCFSDAQTKDAIARMTHALGYR